MSFKLTPVHSECGRTCDNDDIPVGKPDVGADESFWDIQGRKKASRATCERVGMRPHCSKGGLGEGGREGRKKVEIEKAWIEQGG